MVQEEAAADWLCLAGFVWLDTYRQTLAASSPRPAPLDTPLSFVAAWDTPQDM